MFITKHNGTHFPNCCILSFQALYLMLALSLLTFIHPIVILIKHFKHRGYTGADNGTESDPHSCNGGTQGTEMTSKEAGENNPTFTLT